MPNGSHVPAWGQRGKPRLTQPPGRGPNGRRFCAYCHGEVGPRRQSWCDDECASRGWLRNSWQRMRAHIEQRDRCCQSCGADHPGYNVHASRWDWRRMHTTWATEHAPSWVPPEYSWEVDHILPVADGGTDDPANLRLVCVKCHRVITAAWRRERTQRCVASA